MDGVSYNSYCHFGKFPACFGAWKPAMRGVRSMTRIERRSATICAVCMRRKAFIIAFACEMLLREPWTFTDTSVIPNAESIFQIIQLHRVPDPARRSRITAFVAA